MPFPFLVAGCLTVGALSFGILGIFALRLERLKNRRAIERELVLRNACQSFLGIFDLPSPNAKVTIGADLGRQILSARRKCSNAVSLSLKENSRNLTDIDFDLVISKSRSSFPDCRPEPQG